MRARIRTYTLTHTHTKQKIGQNYTAKIVQSTANPFPKKDLYTWFPPVFLRKNHIVCQVLALYIFYIPV